jgi:hypothetical protein
MIKQMNLDQHHLPQNQTETLTYHGIYGWLKDACSYSELYSMINKGTHKSI